MGNSWQYHYETGWLSSNSDWTNRHLGSISSVDSYVNHLLNAPLPSLLVKMWVSSVSSYADCFEIPLHFGFDGTYQYGATLYAVDNNNVLVQTAEEGLAVASADGSSLLIDNTKNWNYNIKVWYLG